MYSLAAEVLRKMGSMGISTSGSLWRPRPDLNIKEEVRGGVGGGAVLYSCCPGSREETQCHLVLLGGSSWRGLWKRVLGFSEALPWKEARRV